MTRKERALIQWWQEACDDYPSKSDEWRMQMALDLYNNGNPNDPADITDLIDALEKSGDQ